jgi:hypothetical protein
MRSKTPLFAHRLKRWCTIFQSPKRAGRSRQGILLPERPQPATAALPFLFPA